MTGTTTTAPTMRPKNCQTTLTRACTVDAASLRRRAPWNVGGGRYVQTAMRQGYCDHTTAALPVLPGDPGALRPRRSRDARRPRGQRRDAGRCRRGSRPVCRVPSDVTGHPTAGGWHVVTPHPQSRRDVATDLVETTLAAGLAGLNDGWTWAQACDPLTVELGILTLRHALGRITFAVENAAEVSPRPAPGPGEISPTP